MKTCGKKLFYEYFKDTRNDLQGKGGAFYNYSSI